MQTKTDTTIALGGIGVRFLSTRRIPTEPRPSSNAQSEAEPRSLGHSHDVFDETVYGLEGVLTFTIDGHSREIGPGESVCIRRGQVHQFVNAGTVDAQFLSVATPGVFGPEYFIEIRDVLTATQDGAPDVAALLDVMRHHGLTPA